MPGSATLNTDRLVDDLVETIDELRGDLHPDFGVRQFRVFAVTRTWAGSLVGEGDYTDQVAEILPQPKLEQWDGYKWVLLSTGINEDGQVRMSEISLTYTQAELTGGIDQDERNQQFFFYLVDAYGQGLTPRCLKHAKPPMPDREKSMGWICWLMNINIPSGTDPVIPEAA